MEPCTVRGWDDDDDKSEFITPRGLDVIVLSMRNGLGWSTLNTVLRLSQQILILLIHKHVVT